MKVFLFWCLLLVSCGPTINKTVQTVTPAPTTTPTASFTPTLARTPTIVPTPTQIGGGSDRFIFELRKKDFASKFADLKGDWNVFVANADGTGLAPVTNGLWGYNFVEGVSPDGTKAIISSARDQNFTDSKHTTLYVFDLQSPSSQPLRLASGIFKEWGQALIAKWISNTRLVYIGQGDVGLGIYAVKSDGTDPTNIYKFVNGGTVLKPVGLLASDDTRVYWYAETTSPGPFANSQFIHDIPYWSSIDGKEQGTFQYKGKPLEFTTGDKAVVFSPDASHVAWVEDGGLAKNARVSLNSILHVAKSIDLSKTPSIEMASPPSGGPLRWSPDGKELWVFDLEPIHSLAFFPVDQASRVFGIYTLQMSDSGLAIRNRNNFNVLDVLVPQETRQGGTYCENTIGDISPDGSEILVDFPNPRCESQSRENLLNLETMTFSEVLNGITGVLDAKWLP